jgi:hypothetical protein
MAMPAHDIKVYDLSAIMRLTFSHAQGRWPPQCCDLARYFAPTPCLDSHAVISAISFF